MAKNGSGEGFRFSPEALQEVGAAVGQIGAAMSGYRQLGIEVVGLNIKRPKVAGDEFLLVLTGLDAEGTPCVAFHSAYELTEAVRGVEGRLRNGTLKWRIDEYRSK